MVKALRRGGGCCSVTGTRGKEGRKGGERAPIETGGGGPGSPASGRRQQETKSNPRARLSGRAREKGGMPFLAPPARLPPGSSGAPKRQKGQPEGGGQTEPRRRARLEEGEREGRRRRPSHWKQGAPGRPGPAGEKTRSRRAREKEDSIRETNKGAPPANAAAGAAGGGAGGRGAGEGWGDGLAGFEPGQLGRVIPGKGSRARAKAAAKSADMGAGGVGDGSSGQTDRGGDGGAS